MKRVFVDHAGRVQVAEMKPGEAAAIVRYWTATVAGSVVFFLVCCVAAGLI